MKRILGLILVSMMLMSMILPVSAEGALENVTRRSLLTAGSSDATLLDNLDLDVEGVTFTSSDPAVINPDTGVVTRPELTKSVTLTATAGSETKEFAFRVPGREVAVGGTKAMPQKGSVIYENNFDGTTIDTSKIGATANLVQQDDALYLTRATGSSTNAFATVRPKGDNMPVIGKFAVEFVIDKGSAWSGAYIYFSNGPSLLSGSVGSGLSVVDSAGTQKYDYDSFGMDDGLFKVVVAYDTVAGTYDLWINNEYVQSGAVSAPLNYVQFATGQDASIPGSHKVDNLSFYYTDSTATIYKKAEAVKANAAVNASTAFLFNESGTNVNGKINVDFVVTRPADGGKNITVTLQDELGQALFSSGVWWLGGDGYTFGLGSGTLAYPSTATTKELKFSVSLDTETQDITMYINGTKYTGKTAVKSGVAKINIYNNGGLDNVYVSDVHCYGVGSYNQKSVYNSSNEAQVVPAKGALTQNLSTDGTAITGKVVTEFTVARSYYSTTNYYVKNNANENLVWIQWKPNQGGVDIYYHDSEGVQNKATRTTTYSYDNNFNYKVEIDTETNELSVWIKGTQYVNMQKTMANAASGIKVLTLNDDTGNYSGNLKLSSFNCSSESTFTTPTLQPEALTEVKAFAADYNAFDKKVNLQTAEAGSATLILASYNDDVLVSAIPVPVTYTAGGSQNISFADFNTTGADDVRLFMWSDATGTLQPLRAEIPVDAVSSN